MRKLIVYAFPTVVLLMFILAMTRTTAIVKSSTKAVTFEHYLRWVQIDCSHGNWSAAAEHNRDLEQTWKSLIPQLQFTVERSEINAVNKNIARLSGAIDMQDKKSAGLEIREAEYHWNNLGK